MKNETIVIRKKKPETVEHTLNIRYFLPMLNIFLSALSTLI